MKRLNWLAAIAVVAFCLATQVRAASVFDGAIATFEQAGGWTAAKAIDGDTNGNYSGGAGNGWAIHDPGSSADSTQPQTAYFRFASPMSASSLEIQMFQLFDPAGFVGSQLYHTLGKFRLSVTGSNLSTLDLTTAGAATWVTLSPLSLDSTPSLAAGYSADASNAVLVNNPGLAQAIYTIRANSPIQNITGLRLEVLGDASLPHDGPGFASMNGNFVLNEITATAVPFPPAGWMGMSLLGGLGIAKWRRTRNA